VCTVLVRADPTADWPLVVGAIRDEFVERAWDPPDRHWTGPWSAFVGGRDRTAGGTWLAVDRSADRPAVAALLNGLRRDVPVDGSVRPTRGDLVLRVLAGQGLPEGDALAPYDRFHLLLATAHRQELWSWDGESLADVAIAPGAHIIVNAGLDTGEDPLVPHFLPLLEALPDLPVDGADWGGWPGLLTGDGLAGDDDRALIVAKEVEGRRYGSTSGALVAIGADGRVRYDFTATPADPATWEPV
jgi:hypothetical protein